MESTQPSPLPPAIIVNSSPSPKRANTKKILLAVFGLLLLIGGVSAGTLLVSQNQDFRERAFIPEELCNLQSVEECIQQQTGTACGTANGTCEIIANDGTQACGCVLPAPILSCQAINIYNSDWELLRTADLKTLQAGDVIYLTVKGAPATETFTKARFKVNGVLRDETTNFKPGTTDIFYDEYEIPDGSVNFKVEAEVFSATLNQWI